MRGAECHAIVDDDGQYLGEVVLDLLLQLGNLVPVPLGQDLDVGDADGVVERGHGGRVALPLERQVNCVLQRGQHTRNDFPPANQTVQRADGSERANGTCVAQEEGDDPVVRKVLVDDLKHGGLSYESAALRGRRVS